MRPDELAQHLAALPLGAEETLTKAQFQLLFGKEAGMEAAKLAAADFAEQAGCRILFLGHETLFARITRRQSRDTVQPASRARPAQVIAETAGSY